MPGRTKAKSNGLGRTLINRKAKEAAAPQETQLYTLDDSNPLASVTHERDLDEFLANAALADADFTTERSKIRIMASGGDGPTKNPFLLSKAEERAAAKKQSELRGELTVPRRPAWTRATTRLELEQQERDSFLDWRRSIAQLAEQSSLLMTPFERNLQLWRQLWRVIERSHLIVQIVDARNPMGFRCVDLEKYVGEVGEDAPDSAVSGKGQRRSLLLINKADLLTIQQREMWAEYFEEQKITYAFFSAADAAAAQEQAERMYRREHDIESESEGEDEADDKEGEEAGSEEFVSGDEDEEDEDKVEDVLADKLQDTNLDADYEEGWSTEGEDEDDEEEEGAVSAMDKKVANGDKIPMRDVVAEVNERAIKEGKPSTEDKRTRVLTVTELEDLFVNAAPDLSLFATERDPNPTKLIVGLVGYPNVGKSSTINALLGSKKVSVSATPGKTKHFQTLVLSEDITLCDCPGLVFPQFAMTQADMVVDGVLPIDQMREYSAPTDLVCRRVPKDILEGVYGIGISVKEIEEGGTGEVLWEDLLSSYAIARGMTRSSFGMPDTSRAARHVLKDYVNAKLLYAHPPPGIDADTFMSTSREQTLARLEAEYLAGRKRAPTTHVGKNADTYVPSASAPKPSAAATEDGADVDVDAEAGVGAENAEPTKESAPTTTTKQRQLTTQSIRANAASAPGRTGSQKAAALDGVFFTEAGPAARPVVSGSRQGPADKQEGGIGFSRDTRYPHQRVLGPDGMPLSMNASIGRNNDKQHFKRKEGKKRSGKGYD